MYQLRMSNSEAPYIPFSQRNGLEPMPPQLKVGEVSKHFRQVINYYFTLESVKQTLRNVRRSYLTDDWGRLTRDIHVLLLQYDIATYASDPWEWQNFFSSTAKEGTIAKLFDLIEFLLRHPRCRTEFKKELIDAFATTRSAYRVIDGQIVAIGTTEQAAAFEVAIEQAEGSDALSARRHLVASGYCLRNGDWAGSIRESIHAVEAAAIKLSPGATTLGKALAKLQESGQVHAGLRTAFSALYGYTSDEEGVRHALVFKGEAKVDETDALFMLGACASFVSYLLARSASIGVKPD